MDDKVRPEHKELEGKVFNYNYDSSNEFGSNHIFNLDTDLNQLFVRI